MRQRVLATLLLFTITLGLAPAASASAQDCEFVLGFKTLHDLIPNIIGNCVNNEYHNGQNGDGLQNTTASGAGGLLVWRKADNWTAFTDGYRTWVNGPLGLQQRFNSQRFAWEWNPDKLAIVPAPAPGDRCHAAGLSVALRDVDAGAGNFVGTFVFTNNTGVACTMYGYAGAQLFDAASNPLPTVVTRGGGHLANEPGPATVTLPAGGTAIFRLHWEQVPVGNETVCPVSASIGITPPDEYVSIVTPAEIRACGGGNLTVAAVRS